MLPENFSFQLHFFQFFKILHHCPTRKQNPPTGHGGSAISAPKKKPLRGSLGISERMIMGLRLVWSTLHIALPAKTSAALICVLKI